MMEAVVAKLTAGLVFRLSSVVTLAGSAVAELVAYGVINHERPLTALAQLGRWIGFNWDRPLSQGHDWLQAREPVLSVAASVVAFLALVVAVALARLVNAMTWSNLRWVVALVICAAVLTEISGPAPVLMLLLGLIIAGVIAAVLTQDGDTFMILVMAPMLLLVFPLIALIALIAGLDGDGDEE